jgi:hypothetical protein
MSAKRLRDAVIRRDLLQDSKRRELEETTAPAE